MSSNVRVRFAPSPTGPLHIGGVRTALFNYLFARKHEGKFILRIEDTDQTRYVSGAEDYIVESLSWLGLDFDEGPHVGGKFGPYRQSERKNLYRAYADELINTGNAYYAFDTSEDLNSHRSKHEAEGKTFIYNWHNREKLDNSLSLTEDELKARLDSGDPYVIRFKTPSDAHLILNDIIRGAVEIDTKVLDDKVLFKSDGMPTYHLANVVDDHLMEISHVIRGEEWLPSLALHVLLYKAFNWNLPKFAHLPLIMKPIGKGKLSKRDGDKMGFPVFPLEWKTEEGEIFSGYREDNYLPEAVINMLAFLGWNPGNEKEIFSLSELIDAFDLERVNKSGAKFDPDKTKWYQHHYLQQLDNETLLDMFLPVLLKKLDLPPKMNEGSLGELFRFNEDNNLIFKKIVASLKERATFVTDLWEQGSFYFEAPKEFDEKAAGKAFKENTADILLSVRNILLECEEFSENKLADSIKGWIAKNEIGFGKVMMPLRLALVGEMKGPDVMEILAILGKQESVKRIDHAIKTIS